jgi:hypothetical protein
MCRAPAEVADRAHEDQRGHRRTTAVFCSADENRGHPSFSRDYCEGDATDREMALMAAVRAWSALARRFQNLSGSSRLERGRVKAARHISASAD